MCMKANTCVRLKLCGEENLSQLYRKEDAQNKNGFKTQQRFFNWWGHR